MKYIQPEMSISPKYQKNLDLHTERVRNKILKYLYTKVDVKPKYQVITKKKDLDDIISNEYLICPRFTGVRSWVIFCKIGDVYYAVDFPKLLKSSKRGWNVNIYPIEISVSSELYLGTIMEGIFFRIGSNKYLVIDEVYWLSGETQLLKSKDDRLTDLSKYLTSNIVKTPNFHIYVSQYFQINKKDLRNLYEKIKSDVKIQEIIFYPKIFGQKIYTYTIIDSDLIDNVIKYANFYLQKTNSPDVYRLLSIKSRSKVGIAYLPNLETSKQVKQWFDDYRSKELLVKCRLQMENKKWTPVEVIEEFT